MVFSSIPLVLLQFTFLYYEKIDLNLKTLFNLWRLGAGLQLKAGAHLTDGLTFFIFPLAGSAIYLFIGGVWGICLFDRHR